MDVEITDVCPYDSASEILLAFCLSMSLLYCRGQKLEITKLVNLMHKKSGMAL